jgi:hypothetical protein
MERVLTNMRALLRLLGGERGNVDVARDFHREVHGICHFLNRIPFAIRKGVPGIEPNKPLE